MERTGDEMIVQYNCPLANKIPTIEKEFIYAQRYWENKLSTLKLAGVDKAVSKRLNQTAARKVMYNVFTGLAV